MLRRRLQRGRRLLKLEHDLNQTVKEVQELKIQIKTQKQRVNMFFIMI